MANLSKNTQLQFYLDGVQINPPAQWQDLAVVCSFENDNVQANITLEEFDFVLDARDIILDRIAKGRIFEGIPFQIIAFNNTTSTAIFDGMVTLAENLELLLDAGRVRVFIKKKEGLNRLEEKLEPITFGYLFEQGVITNADFVDIPYTITPVNSEFNVVLLIFISTYLFNETTKQAEATASAAANLTAELANFPPTGAAVLSALNLLIQTARLAALVLALATLAKQVFNILVQPVRKHKGIRLRTMLEKVCEHIELGFESEIPENLVYLPSNANADLRGALAKLVSAGTIKKGIPHPSDYGYSATEAFELAKTYLNGKYAIQGGKVLLYSNGNPYWESLSTVEIPDVLIESEKLNTQDLKGRKLYSFDTDVADEYTITDFTGTNYEVVTDLQGDVEAERNMIKGFEDIRFNVCLGSRKQKIDPLSEALKALANAFDVTIRAFGGRSNLANKIVSRTGVLKASNNQHSKPKLLWLESGQIPADHREKLSAKAIENTYYAYDSFVRGEGQKRVYEGVVTGFGLADFIALAESRYFRDAQGRIAEADRIEWQIGGDKAVFNYSIREQYTNELKETFIEG